MTNADESPSQEWVTTGFSPAPPGWRAVYLESESREVWHIAGWLCQDSRMFDREHERLVPDKDPVDQRVVPGVVVSGWEPGWTVQPVDFDGDPPWRVLAPGQPEPSEQEEAEERAQRAELEKRRRG